MIELSKKLLEIDLEYVLLGDFTTDDLENKFGSLRQGSGGTYFITVQNVLEKLHIEKTRLLLHLNVDISELNVDAGHDCLNCGYLLHEEACHVFDTLPHLETKISTDVKMSLVYIARYVTRNDDPVSDDAQFYFHNFGLFLKTMDWGGLNIPTDSYCQWAIFCYIMFNSVKDVTCRRSLNNLFLLVSDRYDFKISKKQCYTLGNIFFKNYSLLFHPNPIKSLD